jgi:predicted Zn-dependent peptidase
MGEQMMAVAFNAHPYQWPVIGWMADLDNITVEDCRDYFRTYYAPNNATIIVLGDFEEARALELIRQSFGSVPAQPPPRQVVNAELPQKGERRVTYQKEAQVPALRIAYHVPAAGEEDSYAMDLLQVILAGGRSSRLYGRLVRDEQTAISVTGSNEWRRQPGLSVFRIDLHPEKESEAALALFSQEIERVRAEGVTEQELLKAKNRTRAGFLRGLKTNTGKGAVLGTMEVLLGDWRRYSDYLDGIDRMTTAHVREAARKWLDVTNRTVVTLIPKEMASLGEAGQVATAGEAVVPGVERRIP